MDSDAVSILQIVAVSAALSFISVVRFTHLVVRWQYLLLMTAILLFVADMFVTSQLARFGLSENSNTLTYSICGEDPSLKCMAKRGLPIIPISITLYFGLLLSGIQIGQTIALIIPLLGTVIGLLILLYNVGGILIESDLVR